MQRIVNTNRSGNNILVLPIITFLYASFYLPMGSVIPTILLTVYYLIDNRMRISMTRQWKKNSIFIAYMAVFVAFCFASMFWATEPSYSYRYAQHLLKGLLAIFVLSICLSDRNDSVEVVMKSVMWGGYIVFAYVIAKYGISYIRFLIENSERITNDLVNANTLALCVSYSCIIHFYFGIKEKWNITHLLIIPSLILLAVCGSRKGMLALFVGVFSIVVLNFWEKKHSIETIFKIIISLAFISIGLYFVMKLPIFAMVNQRVSNLFSYYVLDSSNVDNSLLARNRFIDAGIETFLQHPILGVGIDNAKIYNVRFVFLHNNFVEMLANGGMIGFTLFYSIYIYMFILIIKRRKLTTSTKMLSITLFLVTLIMHYGQVAYRDCGMYMILLAILIDLTKDQTINNADTNTTNILTTYNI